MSDKSDSHHDVPEDGPASGRNTTRHSNEKEKREERTESRDECLVEESSSITDESIETSTSSSPTAKSNVSSVTSDGRFACSVCGRHFKTLKICQRHHREVHVFKNSECHQCRRVYTSRGSLLFHLKTYHKTPVCRHCGKRYTLGVEFDTHACEKKSSIEAAELSYEDPEPAGTMPQSLAQQAWMNGRGSNPTHKPHSSQPSEHRSLEENQMDTSGDHPVEKQPIANNDSLVEGSSADAVRLELEGSQAVSSTVHNSKPQPLTEFGIVPGLSQEQAPVNVSLSADQTNSVSVLPSTEESNAKTVTWPVEFSTQAIIQRLMAQGYQLYESDQSSIEVPERQNLQSYAAKNFLANKSRSTDLSDESLAQTTYTEPRLREASSHGDSSSLGRRDSSGDSGSDFQCEMCMKVFSRTTSKLRHIKEVHQKNFSCNSCSITFPNSISLRRHGREVHSSRASFTIKQEKASPFDNTSHGAASYQNRTGYEPMTGDDQQQPDVAADGRPNTSVALAFSNGGVEFSGIPIRSVSWNRKWKCERCSQSFFFKNYFTDHLEKCQSLPNGISSSSEINPGRNVPSLDPNTQKTSSQSVRLTEFTGGDKAANFNYWQQAKGTSLADLAANNNCPSYQPFRQPGISSQLFVS